MDKIAVFFDAENVSSAIVPQIIDYLSGKGNIIFQRAYADWSLNESKSWQNQIFKTPITAIQQFHQNQEQAVDKVIMMDAIELAIKHDDINTFALVSSDNGYYSLALRLRELNKQVIGIGEKEKCQSIWINACNEFKYFDDLEEVDDNILLQSNEKEIEKEIEKENTNELKGFALETFLEKAFDSTPSYKDTNAVLFSEMWKTVLRQKSDFNVKKYGAKTPLEFIKSFNEKFLISDNGAAQKTFFIEKQEYANFQRKTGIIKRRIANYRIISADDDSGDYFFYMGDINENFKGNKLEKNTKVDFLVTKDPNPTADNSKQQNGRAGDLKIIS